jgi:hypothetical protein
MSPAGNHARAMVSPAEAGSGFLQPATQDSTTPRSAKSPQQTQRRRLLGTPIKAALVGGPGHVLG